MIPGLDSATPPSATQVAAARAGGTELWSGYLATQSGVRLLNPWTREEFDIARAAGARPIAFCSGWDSPVACRLLAALWRVRLCLDVEDGIRGDGPWVPDWLARSGAGLYGLHAVDQAGGLHSVHVGRQAAFHIAAWYPGLPPRATWPPGTWRPPGPVGWQSVGSHQEFGVDVDRGWYDDWFGREGTMELIVAVGDGTDPIHPPAGSYVVLAQLDLNGAWIPFGEKRWLAGPADASPYAGLTHATVAQYALDRCPEGPDIASGSYPAANLELVQAELQQLKAEIEAGVPPAPDAAVARIEAALKAAGGALGQA